MMHYNAVTISLAIFTLFAAGTIPASAKGVTECLRVLQLGGIIAKLGVVLVSYIFVLQCCPFLCCSTAAR